MSKKMPMHLMKTSLVRSAALCLHIWRHLEPSQSKMTCDVHVTEKKFKHAGNTVVLLRNVMQIWDFSDNCWIGSQGFLNKCMCISENAGKALT